MDYVIVFLLLSQLSRGICFKVVDRVKRQNMCPDEWYYDKIFNNCCPCTNCSVYANPSRNAIGACLGRYDKRKQVQKTCKARDISECIDADYLMPSEVTSTASTTTTTTTTTTSTQTTTTPTPPTIPPSPRPSPSMTTSQSPLTESFEAEVSLVHVALVVVVVVLTLLVLVFAVVTCIRNRNRVEGFIQKCLNFDSKKNANVAPDQIPMRKLEYKEDTKAIEDINTNKTDVVKPLLPKRDSYDDDDNISLQDNMHISQSPGPLKNGSDQESIEGRPEMTRPYCGRGMHPPINSTNQSIPNPNQFNCNNVQSGAVIISGCNIESLMIHPPAGHAAARAQPSAQMPSTDHNSSSMMPQASSFTDSDLQSRHSATVHCPQEGASPAKRETRLMRNNVHETFMEQNLPSRHRTNVTTRENPLLERTARVPTENTSYYPDTSDTSISSCGESANTNVKVCQDYSEHSDALKLPVSQSRVGVTQSATVSQSLNNPSFYSVSSDNCRSPVQESNNSMSDISYPSSADVVVRRPPHDRYHRGHS